VVLAERYRRKMSASVRRMHAEIVAECRRLWTEAPAVDAASDGWLGDKLKSLFESLTTKWRGRYERMAEAVAEWFGTQSKNVSRRQFVQTLKEVGFAVKAIGTASEAEMLARLISRNVDLIKTIHRDHLAQVKELVMDSVAKGRDLAGLEAELKSRYDITDRRARLIAKDQNNKATQDLSGLRAKEAGITRGIWQHMRASVKPRPSHELMDGTEYDLEEGLYDPDEGRNVQPGELIMCNCECRWVIPGVDNEMSGELSLSAEARERLAG
jgi:uncharacterized protein with gpF-like domain